MHTIEIYTYIRIYGHYTDVSVSFDFIVYCTIIKNKNDKKTVAKKL